MCVFYFQLSQQSFVTWNELLGEAGHGEAAHTMNIADGEDVSDEGGPESAHITSPSDRVGLGIVHSFGSPPPGGGSFHAFNNASVEGPSPFENLSELMVHHAHLAVFLNYVISNSDPAALVSIHLNDINVPIYT